RIMPVHLRNSQSENVSLIDGSVLVNKPFGSAMDALAGRPVHREVDRRFVYIDPRPDRFQSIKEEQGQPVGFFEAIFGSLSVIPREQPIRENLDALDQQSRDAERLGQIVEGLRPEVDRVVEKLFGRTFFLDRPTPKRLKSWRDKAQQAAAESAGYAFHSYAQAKFAGIIERLGTLAFKAAPGLALPDCRAISQELRAELGARGLDTLSAKSGGASETAIEFFRTHDLGFRIRRLRLLTRRLTREWQVDPEIPEDALDLARSEIYKILSLYLERDKHVATGSDFAHLANNVLAEPGRFLDFLAERRALPGVDNKAEGMLAEALEQMPKPLRRRMLLTYLGFPFYDVTTLPLLRNEGLTEYDPVKVDRISPNDAQSIRPGSTKFLLRGTEFYNFGAFFSRHYRENDYIWGRLHGAERMVDLICSTLGTELEHSRCVHFKRDAFLAIIDEEMEIGRVDKSLLETIRAEIEQKVV
ncbi:MAG TPA: DUF3376 domain-containing protein, partial [Erythrobacter sp.]|nr:DUF3376 domain-containing protein [Erythrobacter sp.]